MAVSNANQTPETLTDQLRNQLKILADAIQLAIQNPNQFAKGLHNNLITLETSGTVAECFDQIVASKTRSSSSTDAGYIERLDHVRDTAKPLIFWAAASLPLLLGKIHVADIDQENVILVWGINLSGLTQQLLLQVLFFVTTYYLLRYLWQFVHLKFNYPQKISVTSFPPIKGINQQEIEVAKETLGEIALALLRLDHVENGAIDSAAQKQGHSINENELRNHVDSTKSNLRKVSRILKRNRKYLSILDFLEFNFLFIIMAFLGLACVYFLFCAAFL